MAAGQKVYTLSEVAEHNTAQDCWVLIDGKVYDVTTFLSEHPGGDELLISATGKDATDDFEDAGHSNSARDDMKAFLVGQIEPSSIPAKPSYVNPVDTVSEPQYSQDGKSGNLLVKILQIVVPLAILALAVAARFYTKKD